MAYKVYVSPSKQEKNLYAVGNTNEAVQCNKIGDALVVALKRCGFDVMCNGTDSMDKRVRESDAWGADLHLPIHTNAHNGEVKGTRLFCNDKKGAGYRACVAIMASLAPITPGESDSISVARYYEIKQPKAPTAYVEVAFHDNEEEALWIISHTDEIAEALCRGVCDHFGVKYVAPTSDILYRVQVGAFRNKDNAKAMLAKLQAAGFKDAFIKAT